jgi:hypothetical protein
VSMVGHGRWDFLVAQVDPGTAFEAKNGGLYEMVSVR